VGQGPLDPDRSTAADKGVHFRVQGLRLALPLKTWIVTMDQVSVLRTKVS
jgi:hypothetical protein